MIRIPRRPAAVLAGALAATGLALTVDGTAHATPPPTLTLSSPATPVTAAGGTSALAGFAVSGDTVDTLNVTVSTDLGSLALPSHTGLTLAYNNSWAGSASITFSGLQADADTALDALTLTTPAGSAGQTPHVTLDAYVGDLSTSFDPATGHFYRYVAGSAIPWTQADGDAQGVAFLGQPGYLATVPDAAANTFIASRLQGATNVWIGARAYESIATDGTQGYATEGGTTYGRVWRWAEGANESPVAGGVVAECTSVRTATSSPCDFVNRSSFYQAFATGEPNNYGATVGTAYSGEWAAVTNWQGSVGKWNDLSGNNSQIHGYVVEFGGKTNLIDSSNGFVGLVSATAAVTLAAAPDAPAITVTQSGTTATVTWPTAPADNGQPITGYEYSTDGGTTWHAAVVTGSGPYSTTITGLAPGSSSSIRLRAVNGIGDGTPSVATTVTVPAAPASAAATVPGPPTLHKVVGVDRVLTVQFDPPTNDGGARISGYQLSLDGGKTWHPVSFTGSGHLLITVPGVLDGATFRVAVRATNAAGAGARSAVWTRRVATWFTDPVGTSARAHEVAVPKNPLTFVGPLSVTRANLRSHSGIAAMTVAQLRGRQLQRGQAASLGSDALFAFDSATLSPAGKAAIRKLAASLRYDHKVVCEGYSDYGGVSAHENALSLARAKAVCAALAAAGAHVTTAKVGYGATWPAVVGGVPLDRSANRRVVVVDEG